jgi:diguanylate cyclase (GGDEF)-like protein
MFNNIAKILVIDDERINIQLLFEGLSDEYDILAASNGIDGLKVAREKRPDLILLDIMLGDTHGHDVCNALKEDPETANIPVIFVTAQDKPEDELAGLELGAVDYFKKPFSLPLVRIRVQKQIELKRKTELLEELALVDGLTGVANRRQFDNKLLQAISYVDRNHRGLSLLLIDIDYFKQYNDNYGHVKGDFALKLVAKSLMHGVTRPLDFVARYGGEEFAVILLDATPQEGEALAQKLRIAVENKNIVHETSEFGHITISVGVSHVVAAHEKKISPAAFIENADASLYAAKKAGRNSVVSDEFTP